MIRVKDGVEFTVIAPAGFMILQALKNASQTTGFDFMITSACDGAHSGPNDPHHLGEAYDVRSHDFDQTQKGYILGKIMHWLDPQAFYGFLEAPGTDNEHFHIQRARGTIFTIEDFFSGGSDV